MLLLTGPAACSGIEPALDYARRFFRGAPQETLLLAPTSTLAEHLRHLLAREELPVTAQSVTTLHRLVDAWVADLKPLSRGSLTVLVGQLLQQQPPERMREIAELPGVQAAFARLLDELSTAGLTSSTLAQLRPPAPYLSEIIDLFAAVEAVAQARGLCFSAARLQEAGRRLSAAGQPPFRHVVFTGFYSFAPAELAVVRALSSRAQVLITLPESPAAEFAIRQLEAAGATRAPLPPPPAPAPRLYFTARTLAAEADQIARRVLDEVHSGRQFRDIGIAVRSQRPYVPALRASLERFGIPARFYFGSPLLEQPAIQWLGHLVEAVVSGWDFQQSLRFLRSVGSPFHSGRGDRLEYDLLKRCPAHGLDQLAQLIEKHWPTPAAKAWVERLRQLTAWSDRPASASVCAARFRELPSLFHVPGELKVGTYDQLLAWRSHALAFRAYADAVEEAAALLEPGQLLSFGEFWQALRTVLAGAELRVPDQRRNVVHVMDVFELRQWSLPVVFLCGLVERQFPLYHAQHPLLPDAACHQLQEAGFPVQSAADRQQAERLLFDIALRRAQSTIYLSHPQLNERGDRLLRSFFLDELAPGEPDRSPGVCPPPTRRIQLSHRGPALLSQHALERLAWRHSNLRVTALERFLECPFRFFAQESLRLGAPPKLPTDRLTALIEGTIGHEVLRRCTSGSALNVDDFNVLFRQICEQAGVLFDYRAEAIRMQLLASLQAFLQEACLPSGAEVLTERDFTFSLDGVEIRGRIDRIDVFPGGDAVVVDYKYSSEQAVQKRHKQLERGQLLQPGLYLMALRELGDYTPRGMIYLGFREQPSAAGWCTLESFSALPGKVEVRTDEELRRLMDEARAIARESIISIRAGEIAPHPAHPQLCKNCEFQQICRIEAQESRPAALRAGG